MLSFLDLFDQIDQTSSTVKKTRLMKEYFLQAPTEDAVWALYFLSGQKLKRLIGPNKLFEWCIDTTQLPSWLAVDCYSAVGDIAETIALLVAKQDIKASSNFSLSTWVNYKLLPLHGCSDDEQKACIIRYWNELDQRGVYMINKILTGSLRVGVSQLLTIQALSNALNIPKETLSQRLMGSWEPTIKFFLSLKNPTEITHLNPYPFYLASPVTEPLEDLGPIEDWLFEWKWDGMRAQSIKRNGQVAIWSRGNELISEQFPELLEALAKLPDGTVIDGEILAYKDDRPLPFGELQKRLGRKKISKSMLEAVPIIFMIYDLLEYAGKDLRKHPLSERRELMLSLETIDRIKISPTFKLKTWSEVRSKRHEASTAATEGLMIKKSSSFYGVGRRRGNWWKYKVDPKTIDAVLIYAQPGHGWRANLFTDYTFGVWDHDELVPIAKAYSGLTRDEIYELDRWIRKNTEEKFGPVRKVEAIQVFEIAFEGIQKSARHKSGVALRFPRILRWRQDKPPEECDTLEGVKTEFLGE